MNKQQILNTLEDMFESYQYLYTKANLIWETMSEVPGEELNKYELEKLNDLFNSIHQKEVEIDKGIEVLKSILPS